jgi:8-oxo-dGTP diphosphatase
LQAERLAVSGAFLFPPVNAADGRGGDVMSGKPYGLAVKAIVLRADGACLLIRRSRANAHFVGQWEWPGGKVDAGEDFATAVVREVKEECGLDVEITGFASATAFEMPKVHVVVLCMEVRVIGGALTLSEEHDAGEWVPLSELARWELTSHVRPCMLEYAGRQKANAPGR